MTNPETTQGSQPTAPGPHARGVEGQSTQTQGTEASIHATQEATGFTWAQLRALREIFGKEEKRTKPRVPSIAPKPFSGQAYDARRFIRDVEIQFDLNPEMFEMPDEQARILAGVEPDYRLKVGYAISLCTGSAAARDFAELQYAQMKKTGYWQTWAKFKEDFEHQFITTDEQGSALHNLVKLRMNRNADQYVGRFKTLADMAGIKEDALLKHHFVQGLDADTKEYLKNAGIPEKFSDLCLAVQARDSRARMMRAGEEGRGFFRRDRQQRSMNDWRGEPMDVDAMQMSNEERDKRIRQGLCFQCNKRGHIARNCPDKKEKREDRNPFRSRMQAAAAKVETEVVKEKGIEETAREIRSMFAAQSEEGREELFKLLENEGFA